ncbi:MAG: hypothetical protein A2234_10375 [Elusimicrobia bacterium RIFOXYA2_FULL_58_8]|nr:MAG: hypothetical protein A2285_04300 [Elusimicrobia bacterium RIFOXYA12_FULL_57_11]OGS14575.1 MAG: hypothetical protein A2234_10375 [Elusimicrobia bacterium RIFOXYA2_FULL_58_8]
MGKLANQTMLVTALKAFTGALPPGYSCEKEFFLTSLRNMAQYLADLQAETLREVCENFLHKLNAGKATQAAADEFKADIDRLVSAADFRTVSAWMAGSREFIKNRLDSLKAVSMISEEQKTSGRDPEAQRHIKETYARLRFDTLEKQVEAAPNDATVNTALATARRAVAEYCCLYRVQLNPAETLTPFSLACVDAALAAGHRLFMAIRQATGRMM